MTDACPHAISAGSYLLGLLTAQETAEFRLHSTECAQCQWEIIELAPGVLYLEQLKAAIRASHPHNCSGPPLPSAVATRERQWAGGCYLTRTLP